MQLARALSLLSPWQTQLALCKPPVLEFGHCAYRFRAVNSQLSLLPDATLIAPDFLQKRLDHYLFAVSELQTRLKVFGDPL